MGVFRVLPLADKTYSVPQVNFFLSLVCQRYQCLLTKFTIGRHFWRWTRVLLEMVTFLILGHQKIAGYCICIEGNRTFSSHFSPLKYCCTWEFYIHVYRALLSKETNTVHICKYGHDNQALTIALQYARGTDS